MEYTLILPGFSTKNKQWAEDVHRNLNLRGNGEVISWRHWQSGNPKDFQLDYESQHISHKILNKDYNIIAKSVGTLVAMKAIRHSPIRLNKLILCGIPINDLEQEDFMAYKVLHEINVHKIVCIQNSNDPHGNFEQAKQFLEDIDPAIKVISKENDTHDYPYFEEFKQLLNN